MKSEIQFRIHDSFSNEEFINFTRIMKKGFEILPEMYTHEISGDSLPLKNSLVVKFTKNKEFFVKTKEESTNDFFVEENDEKQKASLNDTTGFILVLNKEKQYSVNIPTQNTSFLFRFSLLVAKYISPEKVTIFQMENSEPNELFAALSVREFIESLQEENNFLPYE